MGSHIIVPFEAISREALEGLVEEFITREGTDYGQREVSLEDKRAQVMRQVEKGEVSIVFESESESTTLLTKRQLKELAADQ